MNVNQQRLFKKRMEQKQEDMEVHLQYRLWRI